MTCTATRLDGQRCTASILQAGSTRCFAHDENLQRQRAEARRKGGRSRAKLVQLRRLMPIALVPVFDQLAAVLAELHSGECDPKVAQAMASVARAMVAVLERGELEERMRALEERSA
jgi:hypothetical protein